MKKVIQILWAVMAVVLINAGTAQAQTLNPFSISLVGNNEVDTSSAGLYDKPTWYQWLYRVDVTGANGAPNGLSHITLEIQDCYSEELLEIIASTAGFNNLGNLYGETVDETRTYEIEYGLDGSTGIIGIKWNADPQDTDTDEELKDVGEYDLFWFSAPTMMAFDGQGVVKAGQGEFFNSVETPDCPECHEMPEVPEPSSMLLLGSGLGAIVLRRKKAKQA